MRSRRLFVVITLASVFCFVIPGVSVFTGLYDAGTGAVLAAGSGGEGTNTEEAGENPFGPLNEYVTTSLLQKDIKAYTKTLGSFDKEKSPRGYAALLIRTGFSYLALETEQRDQDLYKAAQIFSVAVKLCGEKGFAREYNEARIGVGLAFIEMTEGDHVKNLHSAIEALSGGAEYFKTTDDPLAYLIAENGLGSAYSHLYSSMDRTKEDLGAAEDHFNEVVSATSPQKFKVQYGKAKLGLGKAYLDSFGASGDRLMMEKGLLSLSDARNVFSETFFPTLYTRTYFLSALAYAAADDVKKALELLEETMVIADKTNNPRLMSYMEFFESFVASKGLR
jgi:tetratricopeptide (TPR) repeat protein